MRQKDRGLMEQIKQYVEEYALTHHGNTPSMTEIGQELGISRSGAFGYLKAMDQLGMIQFDNGAIHTDLIDRMTVPVRLCKKYVEGITAGTPAENEGYVDSVFPIPAEMVDGKKGTFFLLKVTGESMIDAGIDDRDSVICRECNTAREDDIVVASIRGAGNTLKRLAKDDKGFFLRAENYSWSDERRMYGRNFEIQGVAVKVVKGI